VLCGHVKRSPVFNMKKIMTEKKGLSPLSKKYQSLHGVFQNNAHVLEEEFAIRFRSKYAGENVNSRKPPVLVKIIW